MNEPEKVKAPRVWEEIVIRPPKGIASINLGEIWRHRSMLASMIRRQIKLDYGQMRLGLFWATARPIMMTVVLTLLKHYSGARMAVDINYVLYLLSGISLWFYFVQATLGTAGAVRNDVGIIKKVYYPRILSPLSTVLASTIAPIATLVPIAALMIWYGEPPGWRLLLLPAVLLQCALFTLGIGLLISALSLQSQDWQRGASYVFYVGLFVSPVLYAPGMIPPSAQSMYGLNPMVGTLLAYRSALFDGFPFPWQDWIYSIGVTAVFLGLGLLAFQATERSLTDRL